MLSLGAKYIYSEEDLRTPELSQDLWQTIPRPRLALNCVGGRATTDLTRVLANSAHLVTYGGMSRQPVTINTSDFIFKDLYCEGFWMTRWRQLNNRSEYSKCAKILLDMSERGQLKPAKCKEFTLDQWKDAVALAQQPFSNTKVVFVNAQ